MSPPFAAERGPFAGTAGHLDAPYWTTPPALVERMLDLARVGRGDRLVDLGCGDGRILVAAARRGALATGIDIDPERIAEAEKAVRQAGVADQVTLVTGDLFAAGLGGADVVSLYLLPHANRLLAARLRSQLRPGARIVGHAFSLPGWRPDAEDELDGRTLYLWVR